MLLPCSIFSLLESQDCIEIDVKQVRAILAQLLMSFFNISPGTSSVSKVMETLETWTCADVWPRQVCKPCFSICSVIYILEKFSFSALLLIGFLPLLVAFSQLKFMHKFSIASRWILLISVNLPERCFECFPTTRADRAISAVYDNLDAIEGSADTDESIILHQHW